MTNRDSYGVGRGQFIMGILTPIKLLYTVQQPRPWSLKPQLDVFLASNHVRDTSDFRIIGSVALFPLASIHRGQCYCRGDVSLLVLISAE